MKKFLIIILFFVSCSNSDNRIVVEEFNWTIEIPNEFEKVPSENRKTTQDAGVQLLERANKIKVKKLATNLFHYRLDKYNTIQSQYRNLEPEETFEEEFQRANELMINSVKYSKPKLKFAKEYSIELIGNVEFKKFNFKTLNNDGNQYQFSVYSNMFGNRKLDIITLSRDIMKEKIIQKVLAESNFNEK